MATPPPKKKKGGLFGCFSKNALDSLPRNARGDAAAIIRLQAQNIFEHIPTASEASASTAAVTPLTEEKGLLRLAELNDSASPLSEPTSPVKRLYAQEVIEGQEDEPSAFKEPYNEKVDQQEDDTEEARDVLPDDVPIVSAEGLNTPGAVRSLSVASKSGRIKRSLSLKRSGSTASTNLIARAPPVSSADFADLPASSSSSSDLAEKDGAGLGDMASIRKARGQHRTGHERVFPDISEDLAFENVPVPPKTLPGSAQAADPTTPLKKRTLALSIPESESMRAVAAALEGSPDSVRYHPGPRVGTPRLESPSSNRAPSSADIRSQRGQRSEDTVTELPSASTAPHGFWNSGPDADEFYGTGRTIPFQYVTNLSRPVSIASLRSLACPSTPPRTSSRPTSPNGTYHGLRSTQSFSVSPLKKQATFNGFPRTFFPAPSTLKHSPSTASQRRKPAPEVTPSLIIAHRTQLSQDAAEEDDVEQELTGAHGHAASRSHTCSNCGTVEDSRDFAAFVGKGKASRRTSVKQQTLNKPAPQAAATGSLRKSKSAMLKQDTMGENTLKRWGLAEAFQSKPQGEVPEQQKPAKKMVPGPGGGYITDTANVRWCSALDEIKKALADDGTITAEQDEEEEAARVQKETQTALAQADAVLARLGVET
ncbi:Alpha-1,3-glucan synthase [Pseudozyma hubeiensis]|nr:Alpha-1,3-glucan synthase [Pseudozyma hubeiensis]